MANKLTNIVVGITNASNRYIYDLAGNLVTSMVNGATTVFRYNAQNKLARIEGQGFSYDFLYDSQNRRIASRRNNEDWRFDVHDGAVCIASVTNSTMELFFVRGAGIAEGTGDVLAEIRGSDANSATAVFYVVNHRGDTLNAYVSGIGLIASYRYDAFGNVIQFSCAAGCTHLLPRYTFSTKEYLPDAKVYLYAYRVYDPIAGRWTQRDPIDYQDSVNLYCFCDNTPLDSLDLWGLDTYIQNRQLNPRALTMREPRKHPLTHTFIYTTDKDGNLEHTYSWGNTYDKYGCGNWSVDSPEDVYAANKAIAQRREYEKARGGRNHF